MSEKHRLVVIGAGISGRMAQMIAPDALILDAAKSGTAVHSATVGTNYLHEDIPEIKSKRPVSVYTGYRVPAAGSDGLKYKEPPIWSQIHGIDGATMVKYQRKCRGWSPLADANSGGAYMAERDGRYAFNRSGFLYDMPGVNARWDTFVQGIDPSNHRIYLKTDRADVTSIHHHIEYDMLIWTAPFQGLFKSCGFDPTVIELPSRPIYHRVEHIPLYRDECVCENWNPSRVIVEYIPDAATPIYRRTLVSNPDGSADLCSESMSELEGYRIFRPGKIELSPDTETFKALLNRHDIYTVGRFANWNPDELIHDSAVSLRRLLA